VVALAWQPVVQVKTRYDVVFVWQAEQARPE
jgi:hypothetical protein